MSQRFVYYCKGYFDGDNEGPHNLAMFDNPEAAHDFLIDQEGFTYHDIYVERIPVFNSLQEFQDN